jgi:hypothetical protein
MALVAVAGCASTHTNGTGDSASSADSTTPTSPEQVSQLIDASFALMCAFAKQHGDDGEVNCKDQALPDGRDGPGQLITEVCSQNTATLPQALDALMASPTADRIHASNATDIRTSIDQDFRDAVYACINGQEIRNDQLQQQIQNDPELQRIAEEGRERMWHRITRTVGRSLVRSAAPLEGMRAATSIRNLLLAGACTYGANVVATFLAPPSDAQRQSS